MPKIFSMVLELLPRPQNTSIEIFLKLIFRLLLTNVWQNKVSCNFSKDSQAHLLVIKMSDLKIIFLSLDRQDTQGFAWMTSENQLDLTQKSRACCQVECPLTYIEEKFWREMKTWPVEWWAKWWLYIKCVFIRTRRTCQLVWAG